MQRRAKNNQNLSKSCHKLFLAIDEVQVHHLCAAEGIEASSGDITLFLFKSLVINFRLIFISIQNGCNNNNNNNRFFFQNSHGPSESSPNLTT